LEHEVVAGGTCTPASPVASQVGTTSYNYTITIPANGVYDLVVNNLATSTVVVQVNANLSTSAPAMVTVVAYSTATQQMVQTLMQTSVATMQATSSGPDPTTVTAIILVIVVVAVVAVVALRKRSKTK